ncbi:MAG TPA: hypothetical protein VG733_15575 [Chthoniobacteraceae bacterium]|nr:hypothetical protein [Chthoniobacteraceae bacterium]
MLSAGAFFFVAAWMLPVLLSPDTPHGVIIAAGVMHWIAIALFMIGACVYSRGKGYPAWLGLFSITLVGLLILLFLPDRHPQPGEGDY